MALRCKPNELAVISFVPDAAMLAFKGRFVTTLRRAEDGEFNIENVDYFGPAWVIAFSGKRPDYLDHDHKLPPTIGIWPDAWLRPIRDDGSEFDETMFWKCGVPPGVVYARA